MGDLFRDFIVNTIKVTALPELECRNAPESFRMNRFIFIHRPFEADVTVAPKPINRDFVDIDGKVDSGDSEGKYRTLANIKYSSDSMQEVNLGLQASVGEVDFVMLFGALAGKFSQASRPAACQSTSPNKARQRLPTE
jgi:hypothetical protein